MFLEGIGRSKNEHKGMKMNWMECNLSRRSFLKTKNRKKVIVMNETDEIFWKEVTRGKNNWDFETPSLPSKKRKKKPPYDELKILKF